MLEADLGASLNEEIGARKLIPWRAALTPPCAAMMIAAGAVAAEVAAIDVPVLIGVGAIDLVTDPWNEPTAYHGSSDVAVLVVPRMAHMHNFARTRELLWKRIARFARSASEASAVHLPTIVSGVGAIMPTS